MNRKTIEILIKFSITTCFVGHGIMALKSAHAFNSQWFYWIHVRMDMPIPAAELLLTAFGILDLLAGVLLWNPVFYRASLIWASFWAAATALSRLYFANAGFEDIDHLHGLGEFLKRVLNVLGPWYLLFQISAQNPNSRWPLARLKSLFSIGIGLWLIGSIFSEYSEFIIHESIPPSFADLNIVSNFQFLVICCLGLASGIGMIANGNSRFEKTRNAKMIRMFSTFIFTCLYTTEFLVWQARQLTFIMLLEHFHYLILLFLILNNWSEIETPEETES